MGDVKVLASRFAALGHEARLQIVRLLLANHPRGQVVGEMQRSLGIPGSTLSHHLDALHHERLITKEREGRFLRYRADSEALRGLLNFLYAECCQAGDGTGDELGEMVTLGLPVPISAESASAGTVSKAARAEGAPEDKAAWRAW
jgi:DNA-binding transcriptional ArsR family regulator